MDAITRVQPLLDALNPKDKSAKVDDPLLKSFLDTIDQYVAQINAKHKAEEEAKLEARKLQAEFDKKLAFLKAKVEAAFQAMMSIRTDGPPGVATPEEKNYFYWKSQLESFKQQGRSGGII